MITFHNSGYSFRMYGKHMDSPALIDTKGSIFIPYFDKSDPIGCLGMYQRFSSIFYTGYYIYLNNSEIYLQITNREIDQKFYYKDIVKDINKLNILIEKEKLGDAIEELP